MNSYPRTEKNAPTFTNNFIYNCRGPVGSRRPRIPSRWPLAFKFHVSSTIFKKRFIRELKYLCWVQSVCDSVTWSEYEILIVELIIHLLIIHLLIERQQSTPSACLCQGNILLKTIKSTLSCELLVAGQCHLHGLEKCLQCCRNNYFLSAVEERLGLFFSPSLPWAKSP